MKNKIRDFCYCPVNMMEDGRDRVLFKTSMFLPDPHDQ